MHTLGNTALDSNVKSQSISLSNNLQVINYFNCRKYNKHNCPLQSNSLIKNFVYKINVTRNDKDRVYTCSTEEHFKDRYIDHKHLFNHKNKKNSTWLSDYVWQYFNRYGKKPEMKWSILHHVNRDIGGIRKICQIRNLERFSSRLRT